MSNKLVKSRSIELVADFETTVNKEKTEVWSAASINLADPCEPEYVHVQTSIEDFFKHLFSFERNLKIDFHNLKFDGSFILSYLLKDPQFKQYNHYLKDGKKLAHSDKEFKNAYNCFTYSINDMGQWYEIKLNHRGRIITFVDSLKLLPFSVAEIGKAFETKYRKLEMEYKGDMKAGGFITPEQMAYIKNDVLVMHEAMNVMHEQGLNKMTIGACCLSEYKENTFFSNDDYREMFPDLYEVKCPFAGFANADEYIRKSYHGGWCFTDPRFANKEQHNGCTFDANSHYPSQMHSKSGNAFPVGLPHWFKGDVPEKAKKDGYYYFVRIRTHFHLKENYLPTIQIKGSPYYKHNEWLSTSYYKGERYVLDLDNNFVDIKPELILTQSDFEIMQKHYELEDLEIIDGCYFKTKIGLFDAYIDYWADRKINAKNKTERTLAKLFLNNLYGKFSASNESSYKVFNVDEKGVLRSEIVHEYNKTPGFIAVGSAITSFCRCKTITYAQNNYDYFCYSDTDSVHFNTTEDNITGIPVHPSEFTYWKCESWWDDAIFVRQKTYIEHIVAEDSEPIDEPYYNVKCAGMGKTPKVHIVNWLESGYNDYAEKSFKITDFKAGLEVPDNLKAMMVDGGTVLLDNVYKLR